MQEHIALLTATQTNREGAKAAVAKMTDVADDFNKIRIADVVISINKTDEERANNEARLFFAAMRNGPSGFALKVRQDVDRMIFIKDIIGVA
jgi:replicative DNA helicase